MPRVKKGDSVVDNDAFYAEARRGQAALELPVDPHAGKNDKQVARDRYKMMGNKKEKGKTQKGGDNHWAEDAMGGGW